MADPRALVLALVVAVSLAGVPLGSAVGGVAVQLSDDPGPAQLDARDANPSTEGTIGYVEGYWYDDALPVDDRDDARLTDDEFDAVVYRSMARVEVLRNLTFREPVSVSVISRGTYLNLTASIDDRTTDAEQLHRNVRYEALFMVDREADPADAFATLDGGTVSGFYLPSSDRVVVVSDDPERPALDEVTLGHELVHALQDQRFDYTDIPADTHDRKQALDGLVEGDATRVADAYEARCRTEWRCVLPEDPGPRAVDASEVHWGLYFEVYHPYSDGPAFVEALRADGGWAAVDAAYDAPPRHTAEVIHPERYGAVAAAVDVADRSGDRWHVLEPGDGPGATEFGEATMASMFVYPAVESGGEHPIVPLDRFLAGDPFDYDTEFTDGWAGDRMVVYVTDDRTLAESGYVWRTEWRSPAHARRFVDGYLRLLAYHGAEPVAGHRDTFVVDARYPGAYFVEPDGQTVTIVRAPTVDDLPEIREGAAPEGADTLDLPAATIGEDGSERRPAADEGGDEFDDIVAADGGVERPGGTVGREPAEPGGAGLGIVGIVGIVGLGAIALLAAALFVVRRT